MARARKDLRKGKSASTAAGEFVREEMDHIREGKHGARSAKQAIAIGLSKARRAGVKLGTPKRASKRVKAQAKRDTAKAKSHTAVSKTRSRATTKALKHEGRAAASKTALSRHAHKAAGRRSAAARSASARKAGADAQARGELDGECPRTRRPQAADQRSGGPEGEPAVAAAERGPAAGVARDRRPRTGRSRYPSRTRPRTPNR